MTANQRFEVRFWGVRGGIACPGPDTVRYGGNTACVEMRLGEHILIFDGGTGIRRLGHALDKHAPVVADIFFSHMIFERICGIPFFTAGYNPKNSFGIWAGHLPSDTGVRDVLTGLMADPIFPVPLDIMAAKLEFKEFSAGDTLEPAPDVRVRSALLNHPLPVIGYRIEWCGKSVCYVSDLIAGEGGDQGAARGLIEGADLAILNTADNAPGAADWRDGMKLCEVANAKTYVLFHHPPANDDGTMDRIASEAEALRPGTVVAREGMVLNP